MDEIQKVLVKAGRKDLAQKYYKKIAENDNGWNFSSEESALNFIDWAVRNEYYDYESVHPKKDKDGDWFIPELKQYSHHRKHLEKGVNKFALKQNLKKVAVKRKEIETHKIEVKLVDFTSDKDEPAYDVEVWIDGKPTEGGGSKQVFSINDPEDKKSTPESKKNALNSAKERVQEILKQIKKDAEA